MDGPLVWNGRVVDPVPAKEDAATEAPPAQTTRDEDDVPDPQEDVR
jgi:hypothetical protein